MAFVGDLSPCNVSLATDQQSSTAWLCHNMDVLSILLALGDSSPSKGPVMGSFDASVLMVRAIY